MRITHVFQRSFIIQFINKMGRIYHSYILMSYELNEEALLVTDPSWANIAHICNPPLYISVISDLVKPKLCSTDCMFIRKYYRVVPQYLILSWQHRLVLKLYFCQDEDFLKRWGFSSVVQHFE